MTASSTSSFGRAGRPRKFKFSDLFLWDPSIEIELSGYSTSEIADTVSPAALALYRDAMRNKKISNKRAKTVLPQSLEQVGHLWATDALKFFEGEESLVADFGLWQCHIYASAGRADEALPKPNAIGQHFISIEEELKEPTKAWRNGKLAYCADLIESSNILKLYVWPAAIEKIRNATSNAQVLAVRVMVMQELMLAFIAAFDAKATADGYSEDSAFDRLFPDLSSANPPIRTPSFSTTWLPRQIQIRILLDTSHRSTSRQRTSILDRPNGSFGVGREEIHFLQMPLLMQCSAIFTAMKRMTKTIRLTRTGA